MMKRDHNDVLFEVRIRKSLVWRLVLALPVLILTIFVASAVSQSSQQEPTIDTTAPAVSLVEPLGSPVIERAVSPSPFAVTLIDTADFNEDGHNDIVVASQNFVRILFGSAQGDFTLGSQNFYAFKTEPQDNGLALIVPDKTKFTPLAGSVQDYNADNHADVVMVVEAQLPETDKIERRVYTLIGDGSGRLQALPPLTLMDKGELQISPALQLIAGDFNKDGELDLILLELLDKKEDPFTLLLGSGDGGFDPTQTLQVGTEIGSPVLEAFVAGTNDLNIGLVLEDRVVFLTNPTPLTLSFKTDFSTADITGFTDLLSADLNADGLPDLAIIENRKTIDVYLQASDGFVLTSTFELGPQLSRLEQGDFNGDGFLDLLAFETDRRNFSLIFGDATGRFSVSTTLDEQLLTAPEQLLVTDLTQNGFDDVVVGVKNSVQILLSQPSTTGISRLKMGGSTVLATADLDGDGAVDIITQTPDGLEALWNNGQGAFVRKPFFNLGGKRFKETPVRVKGADLDNDGKEELIMLSVQQTGVLPDRTTLQVLRATGRFEKAKAAGLFILDEPGLANLGVGDVDGDGNLDVVTTGSDSFTVRFGNGHGGFLKVTNFKAGADIGVAEVGDFDGDGRAEILAVLVDEFSDVVVFDLQNDRLIPSAPLASLVAVPMAMAVGDLNNDGISDAVLISIKIEPKLEEGAQPSKDNPLDGVTASISGGLLSLVVGGPQPAISTTDIRDWRKNGSPWPLNGVVIGNFDPDPVTEVAFNFVEASPIRLLFQAQGQIDEVFCNGGPLLAADLDGNGRLDLISSTVDFVPHLCVVWNGGVQ